MDSDPDFTREMKLRGYDIGGSRSGQGYGNYSAGNSGSRSLRGAEREQGFFTPPASVVHVQTSIEVTREEHGGIGRLNLSADTGGIFPLQGDRVVTINGPGSQGISAHTR